MKDRTVSHYRILEKIGEGGMGKVYKAEDLHLKRVVALKFLSAGMIGSPEDKARFIQEAQSAAALNHPNICTIHEIGEHAGSPFIVMEHVEGTSLKDRLLSGALPIDAAVDIILQIAAGLKAAHDRGIVHRDIKPANIMLTADGRVKIMDFGLAKGPWSANLTQTGTTVGTVAYMAPEQGRGEDVDLRADVWSMGAVFYELVAGRRPFQGKHEQAMMYSIFNEEPAPLSGLRPDIPASLQEIVTRCLEKDPWQRYPDAAAFAEALTRVSAARETSGDTGRSSGAGRPAGSAGLRRVAVPVVLVVIVAAFVIGYSRFRVPGEKPAGTQKTKIAVLFFENLGPDSDAYFADGITDAITARLARIQGLGVISRQSTIQYKGSDKSIRQIGEELGVDYVLEGTIQRERPGDPSSRVRIIPQLIRVADDTHVWADTYDDDMSEVFHLQSEIAERVATALDVTLLDRERRLVSAEPTKNIEAYEYYLRANELFYYQLFGAENARRAIDTYRRAVDLDPEFAEAWAGLSRAYVWIYYSYAPYAENRSRALEAAEKAGELAPDIPETDLAYGYYYYYGNLDFDTAVRYFETALEKSPNDAVVLKALALVERRRGKWDRSIELLNRSRELDPRNTMVLWDLSINYSYLRQYDRAEYILKRMVELDPGSSAGYGELAELYLYQDGDGVRTEEVLESVPDDVPILSWLTTSAELPTMARLIPDYFAKLAADHAFAGLSVDDTLFYYVNVADVHATFGDSATALAYYDSAVTLIENRRDHSLGTNEFRAYYCSAYDGLGRQEGAIDCVTGELREMPIDRDALAGPVVAITAAKLFVRVGEYDRALDQLAAVMSVPAEMSVALLRGDPIWDPLRDSPRFRKLLETGK